MTMPEKIPASFAQPWLLKVSSNGCKEVGAVAVCYMVSVSRLGALFRDFP